ncbi:hypothetical protein VKS41_000822 [Umbelopsis sp. WA50703]
MELSICLYCEKHLPNDNMSFCSFACRASEASKHQVFTSQRSYPLNFNRRKSLSAVSLPSPAPTPSEHHSVGSISPGRIDFRAWSFLESSSDASSVDSL